MEAIQRSVPDLPLRRYFFNMTSFQLSQLCKSACNRNLKGCLALSPMYSTIHSFSEADEPLGESIAYWLSRLCIALAQHHTLDPMTVIDIAMAGLALMGKFPAQSVPIIVGMGRAAKELHAAPDFERNEDLRFTYLELVSRLEQLKREAPEEHRNTIWAAAGKALEEAGNA